MQNLLNLVKYLEKIRAKMEKAEKKEPKLFYFCPSCQKEFTLFDVWNETKLEHKSSEILCINCKMSIEAIADFQETRLDIFKKNIKPLYELLKEAEALALVPDDQPPADPARFKRWILLRSFVLPLKKLFFQLFLQG